MATYNTRFYPEKRKDKNGQPIEKDVPVLFSFTFEGDRFKSTTGFKCKRIKDWSVTRQRFKSSTTNAVSKNATLDTIESKLEKDFLDLKLKHEHVTRDMLREKYRGKEEKGFWDYYNDFVRDEGRNRAWAFSTYNKFKTLKTDLLEFEKAKRKSLNFISINYDWYQEFFNYLSDKKNRHTTIQKKFRFLNQFLGWAIDKKDVKVGKYNCFKVKTGSKTKTATYLTMVFLDPSEFLTLFKAEMPTRSLETTRDIFVFLSSTGLHIGQYFNLHNEDISDRGITYMRDKTSDPIIVPLNTFSKAILNKYTITDEGGNAKLQLPRQTEKDINLNIKRIAAMLKFDRPIYQTGMVNGEHFNEKYPLYQKISTKAGRKTFLTLCIASKMNHELVMRFVGHKDYATLRDYVGIYEGQLDMEMQNFTQENLEDMANKLIAIRKSFTELNDPEPVF
jgi:site-specific recombinase XerD